MQNSDIPTAELLSSYVKGVFIDSSQWQAFSTLLSDQISPEIYEMVQTMLESARDLNLGEANKTLWPDTTITPQAIPPIKVDRHSELDHVTPLFGSIWTTTLPIDLEGQGLHLSMPSVVILSPAELDDSPLPQMVQVAPISDWTEFAANGDLVLDANTGHGDIMIELWNEHPMLDLQLHKIIGVLSKMELEHLLTCWQAQRAYGPLLELQNGRQGDRISSAADLRLTFRDFEHVRTALLRNPAVQAMEDSDNITLFPERQEKLMAAAASRTDRPLSVIFRIHGHNLYLRCTQTSGTTWGFLVLDENKEPTNQLDGVAIRLAGGIISGFPIKDGSCQIACRSLRGITLQDNHGNYIKVTAVNDGGTGS